MVDTKRPMDSDPENKSSAKKAKKEKKEKKEKKKERDDGDDGKKSALPKHSSPPAADTPKKRFRLRLKGIAPNTDKKQVANFLSVSESCVRNVFHGEAVVIVESDVDFNKCVGKDDEKLNGRFVKVTEETNGIQTQNVGNTFTRANTGDMNRKTTTNEREGRDWTCEKCNGENFARRETCYKSLCERRHGSNRQEPQ